MTVICFKLCFDEILNNNKKINIKIYYFRPKNAWNETRALFGQNDYIDILGADTLHPKKILYHLPHWVRGHNGNEYKMLLKKRNALSQSKFPIARPSKWRDINKRIKHLYRWYNQKVRQSMSPD